MSDQKKYDFEKMFRISFADILNTQDTIICGNKTRVYLFSPYSTDYDAKGSFMFLAEVGDKKPRYFAVERDYNEDYDVDVQVKYHLSEWKFKKNLDSKHKHIILSTLINGLKDFVSIKNTYKRLIKKIEEILQSESKS